MTIENDMAEGCIMGAKECHCVPARSRPRRFEDVVRDCVLLSRRRHYNRVVDAMVTACDDHNIRASAEDIEECAKALRGKPSSWTLPTDLEYEVMEMSNASYQLYESAEKLIARLRSAQPNATIDEMLAAISAHAPCSLEWATKLLKGYQQEDARR